MGGDNIASIQFIQYVDQNGESVSIPLDLNNDGITYTLNINTDYVLSNSLTTTGFALGDPYLKCLRTNEIWKMPNFDGYSRMLECKYNDKELIINVETRISTPEETLESERFVKEAIKKLGINPGEFSNFTDKGEAFMKNMWIKYDNKSTFIDMDNLSVSNRKDFKTMATNIYTAFDKYDCHDAKSIKIDIANGLSVIVSKYLNPQVRTGFGQLVNEKDIKFGKGALCNKLYQKDMQIKKLTNTKSIKQNKDRLPRREKTEQYWSSEGKYETKKLVIY